MADDDATTKDAEKKDDIKQEEEKPEKPEQQEGKQDKTDSDIEEVAAKADKPDAVRKALQTERDSAKKAQDEAESLRKKVKDYEDRDKSEQEKLEERATTAEGRASSAEERLLRVEVAVDKKLPLELASRLQGKTKEELEQDADRLLELVKPDAKSTDADARKGEAVDNDLEAMTPDDHAKRKYGNPTTEPTAPLTGAKRK